MTKSKQKLAARPLADAELDQANGGIIAILIGAKAEPTKDGAADVITGAGAGGGPHVRVFDGS